MRLSGWWWQWQSYKEPAPSLLKCSCRSPLIQLNTKSSLSKSCQHMDNSSFLKSTADICVPGPMLREREQQMNSIVNLMAMVKRITGSWGTSGLLENDGSPQSLVVLLPEDMKESANPLNRTQLHCIVIQCLKYCYLQMWDNQVIFLVLWLPDLFHCISSLYHLCVVPWVDPDLWVSSEYFIIVDIYMTLGAETLEFFATFIHWLVGILA